MDAGEGGVGGLVDVGEGNRLLSSGRGFEDACCAALTNSWTPKSAVRSQKSECKARRTYYDPR